MLWEAILKGLMDRIRGKDSAEEAESSAPGAAPPQSRPAAKASPERARLKPRPSSGTPLPSDGRASGGSPRSREASPEVITQLLNFKGAVLTAAGGAVELTHSQTQYVALLADGEGRNVLVVSKDYALHHETSSARSTLRRKGISWNAEFQVDLDVIRRIYEKVQPAGAVPRGGPGDTAQMQREFLSLLQKAAAVGSSDIHIVVHRYEATVKIRADGVMMKLQDLTAGAALELCQAAFAMADASDPTYMPMEYQGARVTESSLKGLRFPEGVQSVRLQFNPLPAGGRYMVARLLYAQKVGSKADVDELGYAPNQIRQIREMRRRPYGINIISGPTGSGKSTTLQRGLSALMREKAGINVITIEDPPEYVIEGAAQLPVTNAKTAEERSEKFRQAITASLRSDPDVIMIGEIRDSSSAHLAFEAAMTGHGVWASLHANDAISIPDRLRDMGVEGYKLGDPTLVTGLIGQRLVRKTNAKTAVSFDEGVSLGFIDGESAECIRRLAGKRLASIKFAGTHHFDEHRKGDAYTGRSVVAEVILPDQKFLDLIKAERKPEAVAHWLENLDGITMLEHGFSLMCKGVLDPREMEDKIGLARNIDKERMDRIFALVEGN